MIPSRGRAAALRALVRAGRDLLGASPFWSSLAGKWKALPFVGRKGHKKGDIKPGGKKSNFFFFPAGKPFKEC